MLLNDEAMLPVGFVAAQARIANLIRGGRLLVASHEAYQDTGAGELRVGPTRYVSRLVRAQFRDLVVRGDSALLTMRWEASGPGGKLFPVLDADITVTPAGPDSTLLRLDGAYRPPLGAVGASIDRAVLHAVATSTIRAFVSRVADLIANPQLGAAPSPVQEWSPETDVT